MQRSYTRLIAVLFIISSYGCTTTLYVNFSQLEPYHYEVKIPLKALFHMDKNQRDKIAYYQWRGRRLSPKIVIPIGEVVYMYSNSYLMEGFNAFDMATNDLTPIPGLPRRKGINHYDMLIGVKNINYSHSFRYPLRGPIYHYYLEVLFTVQNSKGDSLLYRTYQENGEIDMGSRGYDTSAIRSQIDYAMTRILTKLMRDIRRNYVKWSL